MVKLIFECGCQGECTGREERKPRCPVHQSPIKRVMAPPPKVRGNVSSPLWVKS